MKPDKQSSSSTWVPRRRAPVHEAISDDLRRVLAGRELNSKIEPEPELAQRYGVSVPTLRNATLLLEREGILKRRQGSGTYIVGRGNVGKALDVCLSLSVDFLCYPQTCSFHLRQAHEIYRRLTDQGIKSRLIFTDSKSETGYDELKELIEEGHLKCLAALCRHPASILNLARAHGVACSVETLPDVSQESAASNTKDRTIFLDYREFVSLALREIRHQGGRRVAFIRWVGNDGQIDREFIFEEVKKLGLQTLPSWVIGDLHPRESSSGWEAFREFWSSSREHPDSLIISDEALLPGALQAMADLGLSPESGFHVVAHGNSPDLQPLTSRNITRLWYALDDFATAHVQVIESLLAGRSFPSRITIQPTIERPDGTSEPAHLLHAAY
ncbi:MAG: GntR family transcriptional regulator [Verrucomicrobiota bacterium]